MAKNRKNEHIKLALKTSRSSFTGFDGVKLHSNEFSNLHVNEIDVTSEFLGEAVKYPFYINAMTGGSKKALKINDFLGRLAQELNIPLVIGSQSSGLKDEKLISSFQVINKYENFTKVANLNPNANLKDVSRALEMIETNKISIHLNMIQELVMLEGDRDFSNWEKNIKEIIAAHNPNVLIKSVGYGMSNITIDKLVELKPAAIDLSGAGGTNFIKIENLRRKKRRDFYEEFSYTTKEMLVYVKEKYPNQTFYASGGINNALDIVKALTLGAKMVGLSSYFLKLSQGSFAEAISAVNDLIIDMKKIMVLIGAKNLSELKKVSYEILK